MTAFYLTLLITGLIVLLIVLLKAPTKVHKKYKVSRGNSLDANLESVLMMFGDDVSNLLPKDYIQREMKNKNTHNLIISSGNPWGITIHEFILLKFLLCAIGIIIGVLLSVFLYITTRNLILAIPVAIAAPFLGFNYPNNVYDSSTKSRQSSFKADLPEAIDYLTMALSGGGYSLPTAFEKTLEYLPDNVVREEFQIIVNDLQSGKTMETALNDFANRVPSEGIRSFAKALNNANKLSVSMIEILKSRSYASRKELQLEIEKRVATLPTRVMLVLSPSAAFAVILVAVMPSIVAIMNML